VLSDFGRSLISVGRIEEVLNAEEEDLVENGLRPELNGDIVFRDVDFSYEQGQKVLRGLNMEIKGGSTVAILGGTGSGKSTLAQLLQRLYDIDGGSITIGGVNINDMAKEHLRGHIGIVLQEPFLYSRTIRENIRIVNPTASDEEVEQAARIAAIHDVIMGFDKGYDTLVGERGVTLSGGQLQRVAIARTLMQKAPILIFDDSMSAVDTETDAKIRDALYGMKRDGILFIISHRITTLCEADKILVLEGGRLVDMGTHDELIQKPGLYRRIAEIQDALPKGGDAA
jgi:ATP-binding cassette subfamily B protein